MDALLAARRDGGSLDLLIDTDSREDTATLALVKRIADAGFEGDVGLAVEPYYAEGRDTRLGDQIASALATGASRFRRLGVVDLGVTDLGVEMLLHPEHASSIRVLDLRANWISESGARSLAASPRLSNLESLDVARNAIGDAGALALAASHTLGQLHRLDVGGNLLSGAGALALVGSTELQSVRDWGLANTGLAGVLEPMVRAMDERAFARIDLRFCDIDRWPAGAAWWGTERLELAGNGVSREAASTPVDDADRISFDPSQLSAQRLMPLERAMEVFRRSDHVARRAAERAALDSTSPSGAEAEVLVESSMWIEHFARVSLEVPVTMAPTRDTSAFRGSRASVRVVACDGTCDVPFELDPDTYRRVERVLTVGDERALVRFTYAADASERWAGLAVRVVASVGAAAP